MATDPPQAATPQNAVSLTEVCTLCDDPEMGYFLRGEDGFEFLDSMVMTHGGHTQWIGKKLLVTVAVLP